MSKLYSALEGNTQDVVVQKVKEAVQQNPQDINARCNLAIVLMMYVNTMCLIFNMIMF